MSARTEKLAALYKKASALDEENPYQLIEKLSLYGQILEVIGGLHSEAVKAWRLAEAKRREIMLQLSYTELIWKEQKPKQQRKKKQQQKLSGHNQEGKKRSQKQMLNDGKTHIRAQAKQSRF